MEKKAKIYYFSLTDEQTKTEKLEWFKNTKLQDIDFQEIKPDKNANWINLTDNDFENLIPVCSKDAKLGKGGNAIFELFVGGVKTNRDEWVYDFSEENLVNKIKFFIEKYNKDVELYRGKKLDELADLVNYEIKWSRDLKNHLIRGVKIVFNQKLVKYSFYRPYVKKVFYSEFILNDVLTYLHYELFGKIFDKPNLQIAFNVNASVFMTLATNSIVEYGAMLVGGGSTQCLPLYRYSNGERVENITDWALALFRNHYDKTLQGLEDLVRFEITKLDIFHYVYAVLHKPEYRTTYEQNLKREFPRIPLYDDFWKYAEAGKKLMELHLNYESLETLQGFENLVRFTPLLERKDIDLEGFKAKKAGKKKKITEETLQGLQDLVRFEDAPFTVYPILKIKDGNGAATSIEIDELTTLCGVPAQALAYKLGNRSAIEWILDQYKPYKSDDKTIQEQFNNYNFADYKEQVIELLQKVTWVSVETMKIVGEL